MSRTLHLGLTSILIWTLAVPAWAYVGPGAGLGLIAAFGALLAAVAAAIGFLILLPLRLRRARRASLRKTAQPPAGESTSRHS